MVKVTLNDFLTVMKQLFHVTAVLNRLNFKIYDSATKLKFAV